MDAMDAMDALDAMDADSNAKVPGDTKSIKIDAGSRDIQGYPGFKVMSFSILLGNSTPGPQAGWPWHGYPEKWPRIVVLPVLPIFSYINDLRLPMDLDMGVTLHSEWHQPKYILS